MKKTLLIVAVLVMTLTASAQQIYQADWESLKNYEAPEWYEDAKLGFWVHWGVYSVPAFMGEHASEWYGRHMYNPEGPGHYQHHVEKYGNPKEFGYKDLIPLWKAEKFDADEWAELCVLGGAKFFTMMGAHHDAFCLWDTKLSKWNSVDMGPKRDLVGELETAVRKQGLKFGVSNHTAWNHEFFDFNHKNGFDATNPDNQDLYGNPVWVGGKTEPSVRDIYRWLERTKELCDMYKPDLYYFDWGHYRNNWEPARREFGAHYYNKAIEWGNGTFGKPEVVLNYKNNYYADGSAVKDIERGGMKTIHNMVWQTDDCVYAGHTWGYSEGVAIKPTNQIIDQFMDIISKRGVLMLSFAPKADGSWPEDQQTMIRELGAWLKINGEAVYATRPWDILGEGPSVSEELPYGKTIDYTSKDIRFTRNKENTILYATTLDWPGSKLVIESFKNIDVKSLKSVSLVGSSKKLRWKKTAEGLEIRMPKDPGYGYAYPVKLEFKGELPVYQ
jgi:alpha-L-fucosidase